MIEVGTRVRWYNHDPSISTTEVYAEGVVISRARNELRIEISGDGREITREANECIVVREELMNEAIYDPSEKNSLREQLYKLSAEVIELKKKIEEDSERYQSRIDALSQENDRLTIDNEALNRVIMEKDPSIH